MVGKPKVKQKVRDGERRLEGDGGVDREEGEQNCQTEPRTSPSLGLRTGDLW